MITNFRFLGFGGKVEFYDEHRNLVCTREDAVNGLRMICPTVYEDYLAKQDAELDLYKGLKAKYGQS